MLFPHTKYSTKKTFWSQITTILNNMTEILLEITNYILL